MKIYLIRHSNAEDLVTAGYEDDQERCLAEKGREKMKNIAASLKTLRVRPDLIVSSPYVRALQTAEILKKGLDYKKDIAMNDALVPLGSSEALISEINEKYRVDELILVGHEPSLSTLIGTLTSGTTELLITLKYGAVCCLSVDDLRVKRVAALEWLLTPKILSQIN